MKISDTQKRFERHVRRCWEKSWRGQLRMKRDNGVYMHFHLQTAWLNWRDGFLAGRRSTSSGVEKL